MADEVVRFLSLLRAEEGVAEAASQILFTYRRKEAAVSKDKDQGGSETDESWKRPGHVAAAGTEGPA